MSETQRKKNRQTPWEGGEGQEPTGFGVWLRRERELREVSLKEIAETTKISRSYLEALESERFDVLPAPVFAKGFLREYARYVGLDPDEVVNSYLTARSDEEESQSTDAPTGERHGSFEWTSGLLLAVGLVVLLGGIGFLGFWAQRSRDDGGGAAPAAEPLAAQGDVTPAPVTAPNTPTDESAGGQEASTPSDSRAESDGQEPAPAPPTAPLAVTLDFTEDCWVEVRVDGRRRLSELHVQGESLQIDANYEVELTLGKPQGVRVEVNGRPWDLGTFTPGRVARDIRIRLEDLPGEGEADGEIADGGRG